MCNARQKWRLWKKRDTSPEASVTAEHSPAVSFGAFPQSMKHPLVTQVAVTLIPALFTTTWLDWSRSVNLG